ncbi:MAG: 3-hydroxyacyl-CoA dehydrogenase family protein [Candidatus Coatesbacteria bacterium]|nr:3-hydroxyacyl-CoA dehydrogenase family protein [Candidatus Coatesbacteria bacterium]
MPINKVGIVGAGTIGHQIAYCVAKKGLEIMFVEKNAEKQLEATEAINILIENDLEKYGLTNSEKKAITGKIAGTTYLDDLRSFKPELVIESTTEEIEKKQNIIKEIDRTLPKEVIIASNTSSLRPTTISKNAEYKERIIGIHFIYPVMNTKVAEVSNAFHTDKTIMNRIGQFIAKLGKDTIVAPDYPGFILTRALIPFLNEVFFLVMENQASRRTIDKCIKLGLNIPYGPLTYADYLGLDEILLWTENLFHKLCDTRFQPCPILRQLVHKGALGRKTRQGFFNYNEKGEQVIG